VADHPGATSPEPGDLLAGYRALVERYHPALDLVSGRALEGFDALMEEAGRYAALIERLVGPTACVVDVGSGVGLPGVVIAATLPRATVHLVERRRRRAAFLELVVGGLGLGNAKVFGGDVRELAGVAADAVTAQAVASVPDLVALTGGVRGDPCWLISRRGRDWRAEAGDASALAQVVEEELGSRGSLVAIRLPGGSACRSSA